MLGNATTDVTGWGVAGDLLAGALDLDLAGDVRDISYDISHWESTPDHFMQTLTDVLGLVPVVGDLKYVDDIKYLDDLAEAAEAAKATKRSEEAAKAAEEARRAKQAEDLEDAFDFQRGFDGTEKAATDGTGEIAKLPPNDSQLKHIFRNADGHLQDTPTNRSLIERVANNPKSYIGTDTNGTKWFTQIQPDGSQLWVRTYNGTITNAGVNTTPKVFDPQTGLNYNPFK